MNQTVADELKRLESAAVDGRLPGLCRQHRIDLFVVFGSALDPEAEPKDLDLAVRFGADSRRDVLRLLSDLAALTGSDRIDLMVLNAAGPVAREQALVFGRPIFQADRNNFANAQIAAIMERLETDRFRQLDLELMAQ